MDHLKRIERIVRAALVIMLVVSVSLITVWLLSENKKPRNEDSITAGEKTAEATSNQLADNMDLLPQKCILNEDLSDLVFEDINGEKVELSSYRGKTVILNFWASWCPYCNRELEQAAQMKQVLSEYPEVEYLLVNKLDNKKETKEQALDYLKKNNITFKSVFDVDLGVYNKLGLRVIPTTLVIDGQGILKSWHAGKDMRAGVLKSMIDYSINGASFDVLKFIENELTNSEGGVNTNYLPEKGSSLQNTDILSESQGLMMEFSVNNKNKKLFYKYYKFVNLNMHKDPLTAWVVTSKGPARVNSTVDDLRIFRALYRANELWSGYGKELQDYEKALYSYNTRDQKLINQYDFKYRKKVNKLKLCFADFEALKFLNSINSRWEQVYLNSLSTVDKGYIGDEFPLYYSEYDYSKKTYMNNEINMAEAMVTLLHLSKIGQLKPQTLLWLKNAIEGDGIFARYKPDGTVMDGYRYESTAIYGLACMIAYSVGDEDMSNRAMARMEAMRIFDSDKKVNGAFGNTDGTGIYSFDQCIGLLSYSLAGTEILNNQNGQ